MSDLQELYQQVILDHNKAPRNFSVLEGADRVIEAYNPLCGDRYTIYMNVLDNRVTALHFTGGGCAISKASASIMIQEVTGRTLKEAEAIFQTFQQLVTLDSGLEADLETHGRLAALAGVRVFPARVKCATLAWHAMREGLQGVSGKVTTE